MQITKIVQQEKHKDRYSVFIDGKYSFSLSESALLDSKIHSQQVLTKEQVEEYKQFSADDKLYSQAFRYAAIRQRSRWEVQKYLERKKASPSLSKTILNKLTNIDLLNDSRFASALVTERRLLRPASRRKLIAELRKKHVANDIIEQAVGQNAADEEASLQAVINKARRQTKYHDDKLKLMQYLARQGFNYDDIKHALQEEG